jgi:putative membrane-bound dehydrogenase-like protein
MNLRMRCSVNLIVSIAVTSFAPSFVFAQAKPPINPPTDLQVLDARMRLELFAEGPDIVTPIGATFDNKGRLLVIESHTHQRPSNYKGPDKDRIRLVEDTDGDGRADKFRTFFAGTEFTMSLRCGADGWVYVATRMKIFRIKDTDGDDVADENQELVHLETKGNYPHNGLSGLALTNDGKLLFGMGENLGADYLMIGSDGKSQRGSGEGGVFQCDLQGKNLKRIATGFWNPFGICVDKHDRIFAVGNDADGRPPCRLVQIVETGDYGYQYRYGRSGKHPLQAWEGELPGTLPMVAGTGEAPCEIIPSHDGFYVGIWGDNRIERYKLIPVGGSFQAKREVVVQGDDKFRPVAFAKAPDGSLYFTDWVDRSYPIHGQGRIWKLSFRDKPPADVLPALSDAELKAAKAAKALDWDAFKTDDVFLRQAAVLGLVNSNALTTTKLPELRDDRQRLGLLQALRWKMDHSLAKPEAPPVALLRQALKDESSAVRLYAVRWVADAGIKELRSDVAAQLSGAGVSAKLFQATLAALELLDTGKSSFDPKNTTSYALKVVKDEEQSPELRALALRTIPPDHKSLGLELLEQLAFAEPTREVLQREAVRTLALRNDLGRIELLKKIGASDKFSSAVKADATFGLERLLIKNRERQINPAVTDTMAWLKLVGTGGDAAAGWRAFFGDGKVNCSQCHALQGRGASTGPDLTGIVLRSSRQDVLESILQPSKDMAPMTVPTIIQTTDGRVLTGLWQGFDEQGKKEVFQAADGTKFELDPADIEVRRASKISIMPANLHETLTSDELRNILSLLSQP